jgi:DNA-binding NtrC family response regulator
METILVVDDEKSIQQSFRMIFKGEYHVLTVSSGEEALEILEKEQIDMVFLDILMPGMDGLETLKRILSPEHDIQVVMITAIKNDKSAFEAGKMGAYDYIEKPFEEEKVRIIARNAIKEKELRNKLVMLQTELEKNYKFDSIIGNSRKMQDVFKMITQVMDNTSTVLIQGESGTGKEIVARAIHYNGIRKNKPFVAVHCAAIPETLLESELFGHEKGAFTGAVANKKGTFELANGGTLFLDEIGETPPSIQVKLLRAIQEREFRRIGGTQLIKIDVRIITASNKDLVKALETGQFREDLYYRIKVVPIYLPPLRERREDIPLLVHHFLKILNEKLGSRIESISNESMDVLESYSWPGNIRELQNVMERVLVTCNGPVLQVEDLPHQLRHDERTSLRNDEPRFYENMSLEEAVANFEKKLIKEALKKNQGVITSAAKTLQTTRRILKYRIDKLSIE